jgi:isopentenyl diphosphate isomerase/L-lactate dehydrogenase-like FMN-dependent dehydrogenase
MHGAGAGAWALSGKPAWDHVLEIMQGEFKPVMGTCGSQNIAKITRDRVATPDWHS